jgi:FAD/FMN-containing dehydrogenase/Fe-S oxidoreductase
MTNVNSSDSRPPSDLKALRLDLESQIEGEVRFDDLSRALYSNDASVYQITPIGVVIPQTRQDVVRVVEISRRRGCSITARGGGSSQAGQAIGAGIQLDFSKYLNRMLVLNPDERWVRVEPGIVLDELNLALKPYGLQLPLDISTSDRATIGGMICNNSSGTRSIIYGKTLDYVMELTVVLSDGSIAELRPLDESQLDAASSRCDLEGDCYRVVRRAAAEHAVEIARRFPKILRRVGGYNLDEFVRAESNEPPLALLTAHHSPVTTYQSPLTTHSFNLARLIVGSEGTLALVLDAKLRLVPLPPARAMIVIHFGDLLESLAATPVILQHRPSAVELVDRFVLDQTRGKPAYEPLRAFIMGDPSAILIVELFEESAGDLCERVERLAAELSARGLGYHCHRAMQAAEQAKIWKLRRAALGLSMSERGDAKAISFVEDTAVAPERLRDYIERFQQILAAHGTHASFYAHASVGLLHVRPVVNLKTSEGVEKFQHIAGQIADLVLEFGGALSGEHGDGLVRSSFQEKMYGPQLYRAFCEIKRCFDPAGIFNPGKIVHAAPMTQHLRFGAGYVTPDTETAIDFGDFGGMVRAAEQCSGVGECRKTMAGTMCPSYMATREEADSTRGRASALRLAMTHAGGLHLTDAHLKRVLDLCLECKACKSECPTGVDMARLKAEMLHRLHQANGVSLRTRLLAHPGRLGRWGCRFAPASNWILRSRLARWLGEKTLGISRHRSVPRFAAHTFDQWYARHLAERSNGKRSPLGTGHEHTSVILFADTFMNYFEPEIGVAAMELIELAGLDVCAVSYHCCGRPLISQGLLDQAVIQAAVNVQRLYPAASRGATILFCEPSCLSAMRDDALALLRGEVKQKAEVVAQHSLLFEEFLEREWSRGRISLDLKAGPARILLHGHCHQRAMGLLAPAVALLSRIPRCEVIEPDAGCCGMAGSFGYLKEHFAISQRIAQRRLLPAVRQLCGDTPVLASGTSCRQQIRQMAGCAALHPATFIRSHLEGGRESLSAKISL